MIPFKDFIDNKEKCHKCGNKIFFDYAGAAEGKEGSFIKCTFCGCVLDFDKHSDAFIERK